MVGQAEQYVNVWEKGLYDGFSAGTTAESTTPLLEKILQRGNVSGTLVELGAGEGGHAVRLAKAGFFVFANEYSPVAVKKIRKRVREKNLQQRVRIVQGDALHCLQKNGDETIKVVYAHSLLHTFSRDDRTLLYGEAFRVLQPKGVLAVSFKERGDYVERLGDCLEILPDGRLIHGREDGITRLFLENPRSVVDDLQQAGYRCNGFIKWQHSGGGGTSRRFVGYLAEKPEVANGN